MKKTTNMATMTKNTFAAALLAATLLLTPSCDEGRASRQADVKTAEPTMAEHVTELIFAHPYIGDSAASIEESVRAFDESRPDITVTVTRIPADSILEDIPVKIVSGKGPDVFIAPDTYGRDWMLRSNLVQPLDTLLAMASPGFKPAQEFRAKYIARLSAENNLFGLPLAVRVPLLIVNPDNVKRSLSLSRTNEQATVAFSSRDWLTLTGVATGFGGSLMDRAGNPTFGSKSTIEAFIEFSRLISSGAMTPFKSTSEMLDAFNEGRISVMITWPDRASMISPDKPWTVMPMPSMLSDTTESRQMTPWWQVDSIFQSSWSRKRQQASDLMIWLVSKEQIDFLVRHNFPGLITQSKEPTAEYINTPLMTGLRTQVAMALQAPDFKGTATVGSIIEPVIYAVASNEIPVENIEKIMAEAASRAAGAVTKVMKSSSIRLK